MPMPRLLTEAEAGTRGRNQKTGTEAGACFSRLLLTGLFLMTCSALIFFFYTTQDHLHRDDTSYSKLSLSTSITSQENTPTVLPTVQSDEFSTPQLRIPLPSYISHLCHVAKTLPTHSKNERFFLIQKILT